MADAIAFLFDVSGAYRDAGPGTGLRMAGERRARGWL